MKKTIFASLLLSSFFLTSCSKDDSVTDAIKDLDPGTGEVSKLLNSWECTSINFAGTAKISGADIGTFQGVGYDHSDFEITFQEQNSSLQKSGNYSLDVDISTSLIQETEFNIEDRSEFPIGTFTENNDNTITVSSSTADDVNMTILSNTDSELTLLLNLSYEITPSAFTGVITFPAQATFKFQAKK